MDGDLASTLRSLRQAAGLSLEALARRSNTSKSYLGNIERGRRVPSAEIASQLDRALDTGGVLSRMARHSRTIDPPVRDLAQPDGQGIDSLFRLVVQQALDEVHLLAATPDVEDHPMRRLALLYQQGERLSADAEWAEVAARHSIELHRTIAADDTPPAGSFYGAAVDLAAALLWQGEFDEAVSLLEPVTGAASGAAMVSRLARVRTVLATPRWSADARARELSAALAVVGGEDG